MSDQLNHEEANARKWSVRAESYDKKRFNYFRWMQKQALALADVATGCRFLDVWCGTGFAVRYTASKLRDEGTFYGVDVAQGMIEIARRASSGHQNVQFEVASAEQLPFPDDYFDVIVCTNSFHHYLNPLAALVEMQRVLRPGGQVLIMDVTADNRFIVWVDRKVEKKEAEHVKFYSSAEYRAMFAQASLTDVKRKTFLPPMKVHVGTK